VPEHAARRQRQSDHGAHRQLLPGRTSRAAVDGPVGQPACHRLAAIAEKIFKGEFNELKGIMAKSRELGMCTFDAALFDLYNEGLISYEEAIRNADSANELRLNIKLKSYRGEPSAAGAASLSLHQEPSLEEVEARRAKEQ